MYGTVVFTVGLSNKQRRRLFLAFVFCYSQHQSWFNFARSLYPYEYKVFDSKNISTQSRSKPPYIRLPVSNASRATLLSTAFIATLFKSELLHNKQNKMTNPVALDGGLPVIFMYLWKTTRRYSGAKNTTNRCDDVFFRLESISSVVWYWTSSECFCFYKYQGAIYSKNAINSIQNWKFSLFLYNQ